MKDLRTKRRRIGSTAAAVLLAAAVPTLAAGQAPPPGQRAFLRCQVCHAIAANATGKVGPNLAGVVGAKAASRPDYRYSAALAKSGLVWNEATLDKWLTRPSALVPGTTMAFAGLDKPTDRAAIIAYLKSIPRS